MRQTIALIALLVRDYDEAKTWYSETLGFEVIEDAQQADGKRWLVLAPPGGTGTRLLLARAATTGQQARIGDQTGGRVFLFLHTDDFHRDFQAFTRSGVVFREPPRTEPYGIVAVFQDLYGNLWDLIGPTP